MNVYFFAFLRPYLGIAVFLMAMQNQLCAQIQVHVKAAKTHFVKNEAIELLVTLTNQSGKTLVLKNEGLMSWMDVHIVNQQGIPLTPRRGGVNFKSVTLPLGRSVKQVIRVSSLYPLQQEGMYRATLRVRIPESGRRSILSNRVVFHVTGAHKFFQQRVESNSGQLLEYSLLKDSSGKNSELYVQLDQVESGRSLAAFSLGEALLFYQPKTAVSSKKHLHVLYQKTPTIFRHVEVDNRAKVIRSEYVKRGAVGLPRLVTFSNGEVKVGGALPFNPKKRIQQQQARRNITDRPSVIYR